VSAGRAGVDTGGTFVDIVTLDSSSGRLDYTKLPRSAGADAFAAAVAGLGAVDGATVVHGTTHVTNAVLEGRLARTALVTTAGFGDVLAIGRQAREELYDLTVPARPRPVVPHELVVEVEERCAPDGSVLTPLDDAELARLLAALEALKVEAVAVCLLHAYANGEHERRIAAALDGRWPVSLSHEVSPEAREYERASSTALNAAVLGSTAAYLSDLESALARHVPGVRPYVVQSAGGMVPVAEACRLPLATVMSGPAAGVAAATMLARRLGLERAVTLDMGGTTTDVALLLGGDALTARDRRLGGHVVRLPAAAVESIPIGGGSVIELDDVGALTVGPRSVGADPGPACYGRGGAEPTLTDACVAVGLIDPAADGLGLRLDGDRARSVLEAPARALGMNVDEAAWQAIDVAHVQVERALRQVVVRRGHDLRECTLIAYGGGGPVHAALLAQRAGVGRVVVPRLAPVFSALGCCLAPVSVEAAQTVRVELSDAALDQLEQVATELVRGWLARLEGEGDRAEVSRRLELRYSRQNAALGVAWQGHEDAAALTDAFGDAHAREYGFRVDEPVEVTAVVCRTTLGAELAWPAPAEAAPRARESVSLRGRAGVTELDVLGIAELERGGRASGPAFVAGPFARATVWGGQTATADGDGNLILEAA
jgi:N-methylhydantoinase A